MTHDETGPADAESTPAGIPPTVLQPPAAAAQSHDADEEIWPQLLDYIGQRTVVPVVGRDLLTMELPVPGQDEPSRVLLYSVLAAALAEELEVSIDRSAFEGPNPLGAVASEHIVRGGKTTRIYSALPNVLKRVLPSGAAVLPESLRKLAEIREFKVFVTTTFDPLLADCLRQIRQERPEILTYAPGAATVKLNTLRVGTRRADTLQLLNDMPASLVVHILGQLSSTPNYVVTEEDAFEFVYSLQETRPEGFFELLGQMPLLIVGCRFPGWLVRFFLRAARRKRLLQADVDRSDFVVDPAAAEDASLVQFLRNFRTQTEIFTTYGPSEFVDELSRRWNDRTREGTDPTEEAMTRCAIFISYASSDAAAAASVAEQLRAVQLPVWLDQDRLGSGDPWERKIQKNIDGASAFVPIISQSTLVGGSREFRREWRYALHVKNGLDASETFIYPLVIDDVNRGSDKIDEWLRRIDWEDTGAGLALKPGFIARLKAAYRAAQVRAFHG